MEFPSLWIFFILIIVIGVVLHVILRRQRTPISPYIPIHLLTDAECRFFVALRQAVPPQWYVLSQVRLANLVAVRPEVKPFRTYFNPIAMKCVDFVIIDIRTMRPIVVVELDDRSHGRPDRTERDRLVDMVLHGAGIPILHHPVQWKYNTRDIVEKLQRYL